MEIKNLEKCKKEFFPEIKKEEEEEIKIKCPLCSREMLDVTPKIKMGYKKLFTCGCENVALIVKGKKE